MNLTEQDRDDAFDETHPRCLVCRERGCRGDDFCPSYGCCGLFGMVQASDGLDFVHTGACASMWVRECEEEAVQPRMSEGGM